MKTIYCTYIENGLLKKASLNESSYMNLQKQNNIENLVIYPSIILMEQNFSILKNGNSNSKKILHG